MRKPANEEIEGLLIRIISDGFNRSLGALEADGAVKTEKMRSNYKGVGSKYYDLVTEQIELMAKSNATAMRKLFWEDEDTPGSK